VTINELILQNATEAEILAAIEMANAPMFIRSMQQRNFKVNKLNHLLKIPLSNATNYHRNF